MIIRQLKATYSIEISRNLYEEIRIDEKWDEHNEPLHSDRFAEGFLRTRLYGQSNEDPFDKWAYDHDMSVKDGSGTPESFFMNHFSQEKIRRQGLMHVYPDQESDLSQEEYWKKDPRISWLYYKRSFDAVFPVICEMGRAKLLMELSGTLDGGQRLDFSYETEKGGKLSVDEEHLLDVCFFDEKVPGRRVYREPLDTGRPEKQPNGKKAAMIYGVHTLEDLLKGLELAAGKALFYEKHIGGSGKRKVYRCRTLFEKNVIAEQTDLSEEDLIAMGAKKLLQPEVDGRRIGLFYWNLNP